MHEIKQSCINVSGALHHGCVEGVNDKWKIMVTRLAGYFECNSQESLSSLFNFTGNRTGDGSRAQ